MENDARVWADIDLEAFADNLRSLHEMVRPETKIMGIIKADAYGHGDVQMAGELEKMDFVYGMGVATPEEAYGLRLCAIRKPILVLGYVFPYAYHGMIENDVSFTVFREDMLSGIAAECRETGKHAKVHIKVDTGMNRIGIFPDETGLAFIKQALSYEELEVEGIFTHFAKADAGDQSDALRQLAVFQEFVKKAEKECGYRFPMKHCANSAAIIGMPEANMDMVRAGIAQYGLWPSDEVSREAVTLQPVLSLKSHIVFIKEIEAGEEIGYGGTYRAENRMRIATIPVGYGDGYPRTLSNKGYVLIHGEKAGICGRICMDQFMVDVTNIPGAKEGDVATLIGKDGRQRITMEELGEMSGRFNYEFACGLGRRIPRIYKRNGVVLEAAAYNKRRI